ncbi:MAG TPA: hypothetical protein VF798_10640, partial [Burkholderiaceae bacterium]
AAGDSRASGDVREACQDQKEKGASARLITLYRRCTLRGRVDRRKHNGEGVKACENGTRDVGSLCVRNDDRGPDQGDNAFARVRQRRRSGDANMSLPIRPGDCIHPCFEQGFLVPHARQAAFFLSGTDFIVEVTTLLSSAKS